MDHDAKLRLDCIRAYHFGSRYNVEVEIVLPGDMSVRESHDIGRHTSYTLYRLGLVLVVLYISAWLFFIFLYIMMMKAMFNT